MPLDTNVVHYLLHHPETLKTVTIDANWFKVKSCHEFIQFLLAQPGPYRNWIELQRRFQAAYPLAFEADEWQSLEQPVANEAIFQDSLRTLQFWSVQNDVQEAAQAYSKTPNDENLTTLQQLSNRLAELNQPKLPTRSIQEHGADLMQALETRQPSGIKTFINVDEVLNGGLRGGVLWTVGARPGIGKSAFAVNLIQRALHYQPELTVDLFSLEMTATDNYQRTVALQTGVAVGKFTDPAFNLNDAEKQQVRSAIGQLDQQHLQLHDKLLVLPQIIKVIRDHAQHATSGNYVAVIDYLQIVSLDRIAARHDRRQEIEAITRELKLLTNELNIPIILFSQLNRELEKRIDRTPQLADLRESGSIEQDSNIVSFLYPVSADEERKSVRHVNLIFRKNRSGRLTELAFTFEPSQMRFTPQLMAQTEVAVGDGHLQMQHDVIPVDAHNH
ncbi:DnaB-like helicase C-terminal domain-containing protein [Loigolactobacillus zhaoyuanensis]|uniref:DnaB-like helicase C-terminal domain-containing protein n=1 Tax=Loigolactobacillus zhaoyuanensis TaxID=2486017 RepID=A0ABW8UHK4_9LACO|nr:DnaB-like helicase C-terminal domain-containing protein [Loigolactobacillus zhaoyuanensis]